jgi:hypothetical protein
MPFNTFALLLSKSNLSISDSGIEIKLESPEAGERVLFFDFSKQDGPNSLLRQELGLTGENKPLCDGLVFYLRGTDLCLCLLELKKSEFERATEQITETKKAIEQKLKLKLGREAYNAFSNKISTREIAWKAYICFTGGSAPFDVKKHENVIKQSGFTDVRISRDSDIASFLRKDSQQPDNKKKQKKKR